MLNKKTIFVFLVVMILLASSLVILSGMGHKVSNGNSNKTSLKGTDQGSPLPSQVTEIRSIQNSMYGSIATISRVSSSSTPSSITEAPGSVLMASGMTTNIPQTGYTANTIDMNSNTLYQGNFPGSNSAGQTAIAYDPNSGNLYISENAYSNASLNSSSEASGVPPSILVMNATTMKAVDQITGVGNVTSMVYDQVNGNLYVTNQSYASASQIDVISAGNNTMIGAIPLSTSTLVYNMAINPTNGDVYATLSNSTLAIIPHNDLNSAPLSVDLSSYASLPYGVAYNTADNSIYVSEPEYMNSTSSTPVNSSMGGVVRIDASNYTNTTIIQTNYAPSDLAYSSGNIYAAQSLGHNITVMKGSTVTRVINVSYGIVALFANPVNGNLYVSYEGSNSMWQKVIDSAINDTSFYLNTTPADFLSGGLVVLNPTTGAILHKETSTVTPGWITFNPNTGTSYASYTLPGKIVSMSPSYRTSTKFTISTPANSYYDPSNGYLYVTDLYAGTVNVYNTATNQLAASINTGGFPLDIAHDSTGSSVYVTNMLTSSVDVISGLKIVKQYSVGYLNLSVNPTVNIEVSAQLPIDIAYDTANNSVYVSESGVTFSSSSLATAPNGGGVKIIDTASGTTSSISFPDSLVGPIGYSPATNSVYITDLALASGGGISTGYLKVISGTSVNVTASAIMQTALYNATTSTYFIPVDFAYDAHSSSMFMVLINGSAASSQQLFYYAELNDTNVPSKIMPLSLDAGGYSLLSSVGANYNPYTGQIMISTFYQVNAPSSNATSFNVTGGLIFLNGINITGYSSAGRGTTSAQAINKNIIYTTNSVAGTISVIDNNAKAPGNLSVNVNVNGADVFLNTGTLYTQSGHSSVTLKSGYYYLYATSPGYSAYSNYINVVSGKNMTVNITLSKVNDYGYLIGTGLPDNAVITANGVGIPVQNGQFNQTVKAGSYVVSASASGYTSVVKQINVTKDKVSNVTFDLKKSSNTYEVSGYLMPYKQSEAPSVLFDGVVSYLNQTGYFQTFVTAGTYHISASENGYFSITKNVTISSNQSFVITLKQLPRMTSSVTNTSATAQGYNATVESVNANYSQGFIGVTFNASSNSTLVISVPLSMLSSHYRNLTLTELISSKVYIGNKLYSNFSVTISSNYTVTLTVHNYTGDPSLYWVFTPYSTFAPASPPSTSAHSPYLLYGVIIIAVIVVIAGASVAVTRRRKRGNNGE